MEMSESLKPGKLIWFPNYVVTWGPNRKMGSHISVKGFVMYISPAPCKWARILTNQGIVEVSCHAIKEYERRGLP